jgi:UDP-4-amino-4,6-dideoxy-N-acetyl-beta-L-altrosamine transaminase
MQQPIPYGRQNITDEDIKAVTGVLRGEYLTQGPKLAEFETNFSKYVGAKYAVAVSNGTAALHLCAMALGVKEGTRVITSPITFAASANCVRYCDGEVWFADIDPETFTLSLQKTRELLQSKPKGFFSGIIPVDFAGLPVNLEEFRTLANEFDCWIIEDACHAPGGSFLNNNEKHVFCGNGDYADLAIFSFHPVKHIATGEGGMITTNDKELYDKLNILRTHGITKNPELLIENHGGWYYEMQELGYNYRLTDFQAALGISQLKRADEGMRRRNEIAQKYHNELGNLPITLPNKFENLQHAYHLFIIQTDNRKELYDFLKSKNIFTQVHYIPVHLMPYYKNLGWKKGDFPFAEKYYEKCLSLPMFPSLLEKEQEYVIEQIKNFFV